VAVGDRLGALGTRWSRRAAERGPRRSAVIYRSWAASNAGVEGPPPADIDGLVLGDPVRSTVNAAAERAETRLYLPVDPAIRSTGWTTPDAPLVATINAGAYLPLTDDPPTPATGEPGDPVQATVGVSA